MLCGCISVNRKGENVNERFVFFMKPPSPSRVNFIRNPWKFTKTQKIFRMSIDIDQ